MRLRNLFVDESMILKIILRNPHEKNHRSGSGHGPVADYCKYSRNLLVKRWECLDLLVPQEGLCSMELISPGIEKN